MKVKACRHMSELMKTEMSVIHKHLDEHIYLRRIDNKTDALTSFINDYAWLIRELYCTKICQERATCPMAVELARSGDLLRNRRDVPMPSQG